MKKIKGLLVSILSVTLCVLVALGGFTMMAFANDGVARTNGNGWTESTETQFFSEFANMQRRVRLGENFDVPVQHANNVDLIITAPNGTVIFCTDRNIDTSVDTANHARSFIANQVGNYTVRFFDGANEFEYIINSFEDREFFIQVEETERAFMPAFRRASYGLNANQLVPAVDFLNLPEFFLAYTNERGETVPRDNVNLRVMFTPGAADIRSGSTGPAIAGVRASGYHIVTDTQNGNLQLFNLRPGILTVTLVANIHGSESRVYTHDFVINVQNDFGVERGATIDPQDPNESVSLAAPTLSIINMNNTHNINTRLVIPTATASDAFNNNVFVRTTVIAPNGQPAGVYEICEHGFIRRDAAGNPYRVFEYVDGERTDTQVTATFNNRSSNAEDRAFWPSQQGTYTITLTAVNGGGVAGASHTYTIEVSDRLAPIIVDVDEASIPSNWGRSAITIYDSTTPTNTRELNTIDDTLFNIPFPTLVDNASNINNLRLTITLVNPNNRTIARWYGSVADFRGQGENTNGVPLSPAYTTFFNAGQVENLVFNANTGYLPFSFRMINFDNNQPRLQAESERHGTWSVIYSVRDEENNGGSGTARRQITMNVVDRHTDTQGPTVDAADFRSLLPEYVLIQEGREIFTIPSVGAHDDISSRLRQYYRMWATGLDYTANDFSLAPAHYDAATSEYYFEEGGIRFVVTGYSRNTAIDVVALEDFIVREYEGEFYLTVVRGHEAFAIPLRISDEDGIAEISLSYIAYDSVGNVLSFEERDAAGVLQTHNELYANISFLYAGSIVQTDYFDFITNGIGSISDLDRDDIKAGYFWNLGGFDIVGISRRARAYTGFEITLRDPNGDFVNTTSYSFFYPRVDKLDEDASHYGEYSTLHVRHITAQPTVPGKYSLLVRAFDISGVSQIRAFTFYVNPAESDQGHAGGARAPFIGSEGNSHTAYRLTDRHFIPGATNADHNIIVRRITGPSFMLAGNEFTALSTDRFDIEDFYINVEDPNFNNGDLVAPYLDNGTIVRHFVNSLEHNIITISQDAAYEIYVDGFLPSYMSHPRPLNRGGMMPNDINVWFPNEFLHLPAFIGASNFADAAEILVGVSIGEYNLDVMPLFHEVDINGNPLYINNMLDTHDADGNRISTSINPVPANHANARPRYTFEEYNEDGIRNIVTNRWAFATSRDGNHMVNVTAIPSGTSQRAHESFNIRIGRTDVPTFFIDGATIKNAMVDDHFIHPILGGLLVNDPYDFDSVTITITNPDGTPIFDSSANATFNRAIWEGRTTEEQRTTDFVFDRPGSFNVTVTLNDGERASSTESYVIVVTAPATPIGGNLLPLTIVLIVIGVALIVGAIVYAVRFKPKKIDTKQTGQGI
ncbi:MAG: hypothetical protein FWE03_04590 [Firmicutes bacterium]|nr:hypothetical protein [Bacillota bacterium]